MSLLEVTKLEKSFGATKAVRGISFTIRKGRCTTLLGPNGAGKTTTLRMLAGLLEPTAGAIKLTGGQAKDDLRKLIGYLPQYPAFYPWMTGKEYLVYAGRLSKMKRGEAVARAEQLLSSVGLADAGRRRIGGYSGGMKQRLGLAQAMMHRPELVILDEPVSALDPLGRREVLDMMREMKAETTILFSTHVLPDAEEITDDLLIMNAGEIVVAGDLWQVMDQHRQPVIRVKGEESLDQWQAAFSGLAGVNGVQWKGDHMELHFSDLERGRRSLMRLIADEAIPVRKVEVAELSLEDLFMKAVKNG